jgi:hypothetical protein
MHLKYLEMKEKYDDLSEKMRFFERVCLFNALVFIFFDILLGK